VKEVSKEYSRYLGSRYFFLVFVYNLFSFLLIFLFSFLM
jgi:hypothetical protein